ncbi:Vwa8 [Symbiodinium natans]|uniref:Vwa8 protein n=1 Tax=Symbiodinium natans TaxID=878477 RepID=A0A812JWI8_9DINO|nr:Vwa8 [Symbiodinium natans]
MDASTSSTSRYDSKVIMGTFQRMTWTFALTHATVTTLMMYASSALGHFTGNLSNALLFSVSLTASLAVAPLIVSTCGPKRGLLVGLVGCTTYVLFFVVAVFLCSSSGGGCNCESSGARGFAFVGAAFGGLGAGILWPSQGAFFSAVVQLLAESGSAAGGQSGPTGQSTREEALSHLTGKLSSSFAFGLLVAEGSTKLLLAVLLTYTKVEVWSSWIFFSALVLAVLAMVAFALSTDIFPGWTTPRPLCERTLAGLQLWRDPKLWLLSMTNFAFGFSVAWVNGCVNERWHEATGDLSLLGFAGALTTGVAGVVSKLSERPLACGKGPILALGSLSFVGVGLLSKIPEPTDRLGWSAWLLLAHVLHGVGRGVYEGANKGIFGDFYGGEKAVGAFSNVLVQVSAASILGYALASTKRKDSAYSFLMVSAVLMVPLYLLAGRFRCPRTISSKDPEKDLERAPRDG